jgi:hypothetical protein
VTEAPKLTLWLDISGEVGTGANPERDFALAVHLTIYWAQNSRKGPVCETVAPIRQLAEALRKGMPLPEEEISNLGLGYWPPTDNDLNIDKLPRNVPPTAVVDGSIKWTLSRKSLKLRKETFSKGAIYITVVELWVGAVVRIRQTLAHSGPRVPAPSAPRNLKLISAISGLYDGGIRCLPKSLWVDTPDDAERFLRLLEDADRKQYAVAISAADDVDVKCWTADVERYAKDAFALQHVVAITGRGRFNVRELIGHHGLPAGSIKTYRPGFSLFDVQQAHRITSQSAVMELGLARTLDLWRKRLMERDAWDRRDGDP